MNRKTFAPWIALFALFALTACQHEFDVRYQSLRSELELTRERGGQFCAPKDFASAEAYLFLAKTEFENGSEQKAVTYLDYVHGHVSSALEKCNNCKTDLDFDGIPDVNDGDPYRAEDYDGWMDEDGIPDPDNDGDGYLDDEDKCPNSPEDFDGWQDGDGCPEIDNDGDTIPDRRDQCPMAPEDLDNWDDEDGCPDPDNDFDNIVDADDACPDAAETFNGFLDDDGCPDYKPKLRKIIRMPKIEFVGKSTTLTAESVENLRKFAGKLAENPELYVRIDGFTAVAGSASILKQETKKRADAVKQMLTEFEVPEDRITTFGFGRDEAAGDRTGYWVNIIIYQR